MNTTEGTRDVYSIVTDRIITQLEHGTVPWRRPWTQAGMPQNFISKRPYQGINVWLLSSLGYEDNLFLTWKQLKEFNGSVKKDEKAHIVIFTRWTDKKVKVKVDGIEKEENRKMPFLRYYKVFNIAQCNGIPSDKIPAHKESVNNPIEACDAIYKDMPDRPEIIEERDHAYYIVSEDRINMPLLEKFESAESYYTTLFHEMVHSTGAPTRLNRFDWIKETSYATTNEERYSLEELVAEMGACYLESVAGIVDSQFQQNAAYIDGWLAKLKRDKRMVVISGALAQKATDFILNIKREEMDQVPAAAEIALVA